MDLGSKTLSQLSEEGKEKMFVTLEVGSKISGYTKEYLERLCRLDKVEYRMRGEIYAIELTSLLDATHTILLSYEDITFVDKNELSAPKPAAPVLPVSAALKTITPDATSADGAVSRLFTAKVAEGITQDIPRFSDSNRPDNSSAQAFSFVGRAVVSDGTTAIDNRGNETHTPVSVLPDTSKAVTPPPAPATVVAPTPAPVTLRTVLPQPSVPVNVAPTVTHAPVHIPIGGDKSPVLATTATPLESAKVPEVHVPVHLQVTREKDEPKVSAPDEWDKALLGGDVVVPESAPAPVAVTAGLTPSQYRPIATSVDATEHHDAAPLFPTVGKPVTIPERIKILEHPGIPNLGDDQKVVVFAPQDYSGARTATPAVVPSAPKSVTAPVATPASVAPVMPTPRPAVPMRPSVPQIRVMPQVGSVNSALPMLSEEHQMVLREQHPLTQSTAFNVAFAVLFLGFSVSILGGLLRGGEFARMASGSLDYIAGVGAVSAGLPTPVVDTNTEPQTETKGVLPFSDEISVTEGGAPNSIVVQPVFKDSVGGYYEYTIVGTSSEITRVAE